MDTSELQIKRQVLDRMHRCDTCHRIFEPDDIQVISRKPDMWMMLVECDECHSRNFVAAVLKDGDPAEAQRVLRRLTDSAAGAGRPANRERVADPPRPPVTVDDVLDMHDFLKGFDGDFAGLFAM